MSSSNLQYPENTSEVSTSQGNDDSVRSTVASDRQRPPTLSVLALFNSPQLAPSRMPTIREATIPYNEAHSRAALYLDTWWSAVKHTESRGWSNNGACALAHQLSPTPHVIWSQLEGRYQTRNCAYVLIVDLVTDLANTECRPSRADTLSRMNDMRFAELILATTDDLRQSLDLGFSGPELRAAIGDAMSDLSLSVSQQERGKLNWHKTVDSVKKYACAAETADFDTLSRDMPRLVRDYLSLRVNDRLTEVETLLSWFKWAKSWISTFKTRTEDGSGYADLPEPPDATEYSDAEDSGPEDLQRGKTLASIHARRRRKRREALTESSGITGKAITKHPKQSKESRHQAKSKLLRSNPDWAVPYRVKFPKQWAELSESTHFTGLGLPSVPASMSQEEDGEGTAMELD